MLDSNRMQRTHDNRTEETEQLHIGIGDTFVSHRSSVDGASPVPLCARSRISASGVASRTFTGLVFLSHELSSTHLHFIRECLTGRSSCFAARQPNAKAHGVKQSKSLVVTQYAEPLLPTSGENQNR